MKRRPQLPITLLATVAALAAAALAATPAAAASNPVIQDCVAHGSLSRSYSIEQLHQALSTMSAATKEYTNCSDVINRALAAAVGGTAGKGTGSGGSGSFLPTPVIIVLVVLVLAAATFAALSVRRRREPGASRPSPGA